jgi:hypothetical protein
MATSASPLEVTITQITKEEDFLPLAAIEEAALPGPKQRSSTVRPRPMTHPSQQLAIPASSKPTLPLSIAKPVYPLGKPSG